MCAGGQDIPVTLRVAGGVEGGKWKSEDDVRATPSPEEEVREETVGVTEETTPSSPMYKPVLDKLEKMSDNLPDETSRETLQVVMPRLDQKDQISHQMNQHQMQMLDRIMRNTRRGRGPRPPRPGGPGKWGGGNVDSRIQIMPKPPQTLGANQQVLAGLSGLLERPRHAGVRRPSEPLQNPIQFPKQPTQQPMQPEVLEEQEQQMEVLGQPKQFASGGIVNALMATPIGQAAIREYAEGGEIKFGDYKHDYDLTHDPLEDILKGLIYGEGTPEERRASFFHSGTPGKAVDWGPKEEEESPTLKSVRKILKPKKKKPYQPDDAVEEEDTTDPVTGVTKGQLSEIDYDPKHFTDPKELGPLAKAALYAAMPLGSLMAAQDKTFTLKSVIDSIFGGKKEPTSPPTYSYNYGADPGLVAVASGAFGHTPTDQISRSDIYGEGEAPPLSQQQVQDLQSQVDSFSEIADTDSFGGYGGGSGDPGAVDDAGDAVAGADYMGGEDM